MITGLDLVEWQLRVAAGRTAAADAGRARDPRPCHRGADLRRRPGAGFPAVDRHARASAAAGAKRRHVRVDTGVREGDAITPHYDPMIAKLIVWDEDRGAAVRPAGVPRSPDTRSSACRPISAAARDRRASRLRGGRGRYRLHRAPQSHCCRSAFREPAVLAAAALKVLAELRASRVPSADPWSPWNVGDAWRMNGDGYQDLHLRSRRRAHSDTCAPAAG